MEEIKTANQYDRYLSRLDVWAIAFGCTIGWSAFLLPGSTFLPVAGPLGTLISIAVSVAIMLVIGASFSYLMRNRPGTGGVYAYTRDAFGRRHAFICAWFLSLSYLTILFMNATSLFLAIRLVFGEQLQSGYASYTIAGNRIFTGEVGASIIALAVVGLLFINAKPFLQRFQTILAFVLLVCVVIVGAVCLPHLNLEGLHDAFGIQGSSRPFAVFSIVMLSPWAFAGFEVISLETVHFRFKAHWSRWIIMISILMGGLFYLCLTFIGVSAVPDGYATWQAYIADLGQHEGLTAIPTFYAASAIMGKAGLILMVIAALAAILTGMIAAYRATLRVLSTMTEDRLLSEKFANTTNSIIFIMAVAILISIFGRSLLDSFTELASFGAVIGFGYTTASAWRIAKRNGERPYIWLGAAGTVLSAVFAIVRLIPRFTVVEIMGPKALLMLAIWCALGLLFYLFTARRRNKDRA